MRLKQRKQGEITMRVEDSFLGRKVILRFNDFISMRETEGWPLLVAAVVALVWANSPWSASYESFWSSEIALRIDGFTFSETLHHLVNDLLLPVFFFILGLDLKHELVVGELSSWKRAVMPLFIGLGGMLLPVAIYLALAPSGSYSHGWGIPVATDVAFTLAVLVMLGDRIPVQLKILTIAFAAIDDIGGVLAIALFYTGELSWWYLAAASGIFGVIAVLRLLRLRTIVFYAALVIAFMFAMYHSGIHTTIAGVALGLLVPARPMFRRGDFVSRIDELNDRVQTLRDKIRRLEPKEKSEAELAELEQWRNEEEAVLGQMETLVKGTEPEVGRLIRNVNPWVNYIVLPLFALANAGIHFDISLLGATFTNPAARGVLLGLLLGKPLGIVGAALLAHKLNVARLPTGIGWHHLAGMGLLAGMGFTVSIFIAGLAFDQPDILVPAKAAVLLASVLAGLFGYLFLRLTCRQ